MRELIQKLGSVINKKMDSTRLFNTAGDGQFAIDLQVSSVKNVNSVRPMR